MSDGKQARALLDAAERDLRAVEGMADPATFADEITGFHAQQAAEKALKAWLALRGVQYPRTHDLRRLLELLEDRGEQVREFWPLLEYSQFAVLHRYEGLPGDTDPLDRALAIERLRALCARLEAILVAASD